MPAPQTSCVIERADYQDGYWAVLAHVKIDANTYTSPFVFEGEAGMTVDEMKVKVLGQY